MANHIIIGSFIKKVCKQIFSKKLIIKIILRVKQSYTEGYIRVQKD